MLLGRSSATAHGVMNSADLIKTLNNLLKKKTRKTITYKPHDKLFLVIRVTSPIFDKSTFDMFEDNIVIPENQYDEIWLVLFDFSEKKWQNLKQIK